MKIAEITETLHGELPSIGRPCLLVRLSGCNLNCPYCDTNHEQKFELTPTELYSKALESGLDLLITGGEPLLQMPELVEFFNIIYHNLNSTAYRPHVTVESNGTISAEYILRESLYPIYFAFDLKHLNLIGPELFATSLHIIQSETGLKDVVKFIFWDDDSFNFYLSIAEDLSLRCTLVFSPEFSYFQKKRDFSEEVNALLKLSKKGRNVAFQVQLHKLVNLA